MIEKRIYIVPVDADNETIHQMIAECHGFVSMTTTPCEARSMSEEQPDRQCVMYTFYLERDIKSEQKVLTP